MVSETTQRRHRRKRLLDQMRFNADLACESHGLRSHVEKVFTNAVELLKLDNVTQDKVKELVEIIGACSIEIGGIHWNVSEGQLHINATIVLEELAAHMVWGSGVRVKEVQA